MAKIYVIATMESGNQYQTQFIASDIEEVQKNLQEKVATGKGSITFGNHLLTTYCIEAFTFKYDL